MNIEDLLPLVDSDFSISEIALRLNKSKTTIRYWLKTFGLKTLRLPGRRPKKDKNKNCLSCERPLNRKQNKFCSYICQQNKQYDDYILEWLCGRQSGRKGDGQVSNHIRKWLFIKAKGKCENCGWGEINSVTGKSTLTIHHIDGNCNNNDQSNISLICPNCHSLTDNYGTLNRGNSRRKRR
jgi:hypothetical protein